MSASHAAKRGRGQRDPLARGRLTPRDREVIQLVALHGAASRSQLMELASFGSVSRANRRLRFLFDHRYLRRAYIATGSHSLETIYVLGRSGVSIAAELAVIDRLELARHAVRQPERAYLEHQLGVLSLRIALKDMPPGVSLTHFLSEPECLHEYELVKGSRTVRRLIKPDAFFEMEVQGDRRPFFIEFDRGHTSIPQMRGVFERYGHYGREGAFQSIYGAETFEVLVVTTAGHRRIAHLAAAAKDGRVVVRFATNEDVRFKGLFSQIWRGSPDGRQSALVNLSTGGRLP